MLKSSTYRLIEMFIIFVLIPVSLVLEFSIRLKIAIMLIGFIYILGVIFGVERIKIHIVKGIKWKRFWRLTFLKLLVIIGITSVYMLFVEPENWFKPILQDYRVWILFCFIYSVFSVYPQELIYRTFFFKRYKDLFKNPKLFILVNAALFSLAHLFFANALVMLLTFIGGIAFALTFNKTKSTLLVSIEHAIYGSWLFTVGMGEMLGFPV